MSEKKILENHKCPIHIIAYWANDAKENNYYNMDYLNMNGRPLYTPDYKNSCSFRLYPHIQHFGGKCVQPMRIHQYLYFMKRKKTCHKNLRLHVLPP